MPFRFPAFFRVFSLLIFSLGLAACSPEPEPQPFIGNDISTAGIGRTLALVDGQGQPRSLKDFRGKTVVVFFGFTQCPDVCPTAMVQLASAMEMLGEQAKDVQVLLITVDPERDTPDVMQAYVEAFDPRFIGLTGTPEQVRKTAQSFKAFYVKVPSPQIGQYTMDHSSSFYLIDSEGKTRVLMRGDASAEDIAHDVQLLATSAP
ncbi:SCO family protein [Paenalcaligenes sp. Me131]|uniref:SCO family protein n=1 Tax=Paenalcaligenes sp. Me131 TaxID=3392636 RepID=UPI003D289929